MKTSLTDSENNIILALDGDLDTAAAQQVENVFQKLQNIKDKNITLDCSSLNYISSSGLRLFLSLLKSCKPNGNSLVLENVNENIKKVFAMTGFSSLFNIK